MKNLQEIEKNLSENGKILRNLHYDLADVRKTYYDQSEEFILAKEQDIIKQIEIFYIDPNQNIIDTTKISQEEFDILYYLPHPYDFSYYDEDCNYKGSYLIDYPIVRTLAGQKSCYTTPDFYPQKNTTYFGNEIDIGDPYFVCCFYELTEEYYTNKLFFDYDNKLPALNIVASIVTIKDFEKLQNEYEIYSNSSSHKNIPTFKKKKIDIF